MLSDITPSKLASDRCLKRFAIFYLYDELPSRGQLFPAELPFT